MRGIAYMVMEEDPRILPATSRSRAKKGSMIRDPAPSITYQRAFTSTTAQPHPVHPIRSKTALTPRTNPRPYINIHDTPDTPNGPLRRRKIPPETHELS